MAKKQQPEQKVETILIKSHSKFKDDLIARIELGKKILENEVNTEKDFEELKSQYSRWNDYNVEYLKRSFNKTINEYRTQYDKAGIPFIFTSRAQSLNEELKEFVEKVHNKIDNLQKLVEKADLIPSEISDQKEDTKTEFNTNQVFIVHGHDELAKTEVARFIEKLGFEAIILHEQVSAGQTIIEKIESYSNVGFGIVLYTACDVGNTKNNMDNLNFRARQNVVFEHGFLIGKLGRKNVTALVKDTIETPNDISGVVYISMEGEWKLSIAKEMKNSGYSIDYNLVL